MDYILLHIPSQTIPKEPFKLIEGVLCFYSNVVNESLGIYNRSLGLTIDITKNENYQRIISDFIATLNVFRQEYIAVHLLSQLDYKSHTIQSDEKIEKFIEPYLEKVTTYAEDFNSLYVHIVSTRITYSFVAVFNKLLKEEKTSFLYGSIKYLSMSNVIIMTSNRIYDNALFENALLFQLFEAIMVHHEKIYKDEVKICDTCKKETRIGLSARIERFVNDIKLKDEKIIKAIKTIAKTRHSFFHSLSGLPRKEHIDKAVGKIGDNYISFENELKHADGVLIGKGVLKGLITIYLIEMLLFEKLTR